MYFIDANIIIYAAGKPSRYKSPCELILAGVQEKLLSCVTSTEVLQEILHYYIALKRKAIGISIMEGVLPWMVVLPITKKEIEQTVILHERYPQLSSRDAIHVATMMNHSIKDLISVDRDFDSQKEVCRIDVFDLVSSWANELSP